MKPADKVRVLRNSKKLTQTNFGSIIGLKQHQIRDIESGKQKVSEEIAKKIEENFYIPYKNFLFDDNLPIIESIKNNELETTRSVSANLHVNTVTAIKLSPHVSAGNGSNIESIDSVEKMGEFVLDVCTFKTPPPSKLFAMQVDGYSMTPMIFPDSWVVFDDTTQFKGDGLYVINWRNVLMVKLLQVNSEGMLRIVSANKEYESYTVSPDDQSVFRVFGKVLRTII